MAPAPLTLTPAIASPLSINNDAFAALKSSVPSTATPFSTPPSAASTPPSSASVPPFKDPYVSAKVPACNENTPANVSAAASYSNAPASFTPPPPTVSVLYNVTVYAEMPVKLAVSAGPGNTPPVQSAVLLQSPSTPFQDITAMPRVRCCGHRIHPGHLRSREHREERKVFFFEKKKQKTLRLGPEHTGRFRADGANVREHRSLTLAGRIHNLAVGIMEVSRTRCHCRYRYLHTRCRTKSHRTG